MPIQDYGLRPLGLGADRTMGHIANLQMEQQRTNAFDQRNALLDRRYTDEQTQMQAEARKAQALTELKFLHPLIERGDAGAAQRAARLVSELSPEAGQALQADPANLDPKNFAPALGKLLGIAPTKPDYRTVGGAMVEITPEGPREVYRPAQRAPLPRPSAGGGGGPAAATAPAAKPLPTSALRIVDEAKQAQAAASDSKTMVDGAIAMLERGDVELGAVRNLESRARNFAGASDANSRAYANIRQTLEKLRNNYLLLAKGVQTEGDAQRAWNSEIGENVQNDNALALQQLKKAQGMIDRAMAAQDSRIQAVYENFGGAPPAAPQRTTPENRVPRKEAPPQAIEYLKAHPETKAAFFAKYGYLP